MGDEGLEVGSEAVEIFAGDPAPPAYRPERSQKGVHAADLRGNDARAIVVEFPRQAEAFERAAIPGHGNDGAVEAGGADGLVEGGGGAGHLDDGVGTTAFGKIADALGDRA